MAALNISAEGHFNIPEGTTTIVSRASHGWVKEGEDSWEEWGVDKKAVKTVTIPDSVTTIEVRAFSGCISLTSITIPESVTTIGENAFYYCTSLASIAIPDSVTTIGYCAFAWCSSLTSIAIPDAVTTIGNSAFEHCSSLASITIPDSVTSIGYCAFYGCTSLASIGIPDSVATIGACAFAQCDSLASISIPDSVTSIGNSAFSYCNSLASITIPESVATIGVAAFHDSSSMATVLVKPAAAFNGRAAAENLWNKVFEKPGEDLDDDFYDDIAQESGEDQVAPFQHVARIWAPDTIVHQLTGPFAEYATFASIPRAMRAAPDATTWAVVQLWVHWSDPEVDAAEHRVLCKPRQQMVWTVMHVAERLEILPSEMWLLIMTFVKHEQPAAGTEPLAP